MSRVLYVPRPVGPRDAGELQRSMYALKRDGMAPATMWPPREGFYERPWMIPTGNGPAVKRWIPIRIWLSEARDPVTGETLDRSPTWLAEIDGKPGRLEYVWPECSGRPITEAAYEELLASRDRDDGFNPDDEDPWNV